MAWTYTQNFDSLTNGDLNGQDSWSGSTAYDVQDSTFYQGSKAVSVVINDSQAIDRTITQITDTGDFYVAMRRTTNSGNGAIYVILRDGNPNNRVFIRMGSDGNISGFDNGVADYVTVSAYSANQWYVVNCQFDVSTEQFRLRVHNGTSWGSFSSWLTVNGGSFDSVESIRLDTSDGNDGATGYIDYFSPTDPTTQPSVAQILFGRRRR